MLNLVFQKAKLKSETTYIRDGRDYFDRTFEMSWFENPYAEYLLEFVDKVEYKNGLLFKDGKPIPPQNLCTSTKVAMLVYEFPDLVFNATQIGEGAFLAVAALCELQDRTVVTYRLIRPTVLDGTELQKDYQPITLEEYEDNVFDWLDECLND